MISKKPKNTPWILVTSPLFATGFGLICSEIYEMEKDIPWLKEELKKFIKEKSGAKMDGKENE